MSPADAEQDFDERINPYVVGPPIGQPDAPSFVGREGMLRDLVQFASARDASRLATVWGLRRAGKTSLLIQTRNRLPAGTPVAFVDIVAQLGQHYTLREFTGTLAEQFARSLGRPCPEPGGWDSVEAFLHDGLRPLLEGVARAPVLLLDELEALAELEPGSVDTRVIYSLTTSPDSPLRVIASYGRPPEDLPPEILALVKNTVSWKRIGLLAPEEVDELITEPVAGWLSYTPAAREAIREEAGDYPVLLQAILHELVEGVLDEELTELEIDAARVAAVVERVQERLHAQIQWILISLSLPKLVVLYALARATEEGPARYGEVLAQLKALSEPVGVNAAVLWGAEAPRLREDYLRGSDADGWRLRQGIIARYLRARDFERVLEETFNRYSDQAMHAAREAQREARPGAALSGLQDVLRRNPYRRDARRALVHLYPELGGQLDLVELLRLVGPVAHEAAVLDPLVDILRPHAGGRILTWLIALPTCVDAEVEAKRRALERDIRGKLRRRRLLGAVLVLVLLAAGIQSGMSYARDVVRLLQSNFVALRAHGADAVIADGSGAFPAERLPEVVVALEAMLGGDPPEQERAIKALDALGGQASAAVPALVRAVGQLPPELRDAARTTLERIGSPDVASLKTLANLLGDSRESVARAAASSLAEMGPEATAELARIVANDSLPEARRWALEALRLQGETAAGAARDVARVVFETKASQELWEAAEETLVAFPRAAVPALVIGLAEDTPAEVRLRVDRVLERIDEAVDELARIVASDDPIASESALALLLRLPDSVARLGQMLRSDAPETAGPAQAALVRLGNRPKRAEETWMRLMTLVYDPQVPGSARQRAIRVLQQLDPTRPDQLHELVQLLGDPDPRVRADVEAALEALEASVDTSGSPLRDALVAALFQEELRERAGRLLRAQGRARPAETGRALVETLQRLPAGGNEACAREIEGILASLQPPPRDLLAELLRDATQPLVARETAARVLGAQKDPPLPLLVGSLVDEGLYPTLLQLFRGDALRGAAVDPLLDALGNAELHEPASQVLVELGLMNVPDLVGALARPGRAPAVTQVLLQLSESSPTQVARALVDALEFEDRRSAAEHVLVQLGGPALSALLDAFLAGELPLPPALAVLQQWGPSAATALAAELSGEDRERALRAAVALNGFEKEEALRGVRSDVLAALTRYREEGSQLLASILGRFDEPSPVRIADALAARAEGAEELTARAAVDYAIVLHARGKGREAAGFLDDLRAKRLPQTAYQLAQLRREWRDGPTLERLLRLGFAGTRGAGTSSKQLQAQVFPRLDAALAVLVQGEGAGSPRLRTLLELILSRDRPKLARDQLDRADRARLPWDDPAHPGPVLFAVLLRVAGGAPSAAGDSRAELWNEMLSALEELPPAAPLPPPLDADPRRANQLLGLLLRARPTPSAQQDQIERRLNSIVTRLQRASLYPPDQTEEQIRAARLAVAYAETLGRDNGAKYLDRLAPPRSDQDQTFHRRVRFYRSESSVFRTKGP